MGDIVDQISKLADKLYKIVLLIAVVWGVAFFLTGGKIDVATIASILAVVVIWLIVLNNDINKIKRSIKMEGEE